MSLVSDSSGDEKENKIPTRFPILKNWKIIFISCMASMFEFYDFGVLGFFTHEIGQALFPPNLTEVQYDAWVYGLFWVGFSTRPFGGALFGYISDIYGRKKAFRVSIMTMAICTFLTGCIPSYNTIGIAAPLILLLFRLIQGLSTGGEISSVFVYLYEIAPTNRRALWMSLIVISSVGAMFATLVKITINQTLTEQQIHSFGWRIPFWIGIILAIVAWYSKYVLKPTPVFAAMVQENNDLHNLMHITRRHTDKWFAFSDSSRYMRSVANGREISENAFSIAFCSNCKITTILILATALNQLTPFLFNIFLPDYLQSESMRGWSNKQSYQFNAYLMVFSGTVIVAVGFCTDKYGPLRFLIISGVSTMIIAPFIWYGFTVTTEPWQDLILSLPMIFFPNITCGAVYFWYIDTLLLDPRTRTRIFGVAFNMGALLFAGTAPYLGTFFIELCGIAKGAFLTGSWVSVCAFISLSAYLYEYVYHPLRADMYHMQNNAFNEEQQELTAQEPSLSIGRSNSNIEHDYVEQLK